MMRAAGLRRAAQAGCGAAARPACGAAPCAADMGMSAKLARQQLAQQQQLVQARGMVTVRSKDPGDVKRKERRDKRRRTSDEFKQPLQKMTMQVMSNGATVQVPNMHPEAFPVWRLRTDTANGAAWMSPKAREEQLRAAEERRREQAEKRKRRG